MMQNDMRGAHQYPFSYVIENYGVPARMGRRVLAQGKPGIIAADRGNYIGVNLDEDKPGVIRNYHPTDNIEYLGIGEIRKLTRAQQRYKKYMDVAESYDSFAHYIGVRS